MADPIQDKINIGRAINLLGDARAVLRDKGIAVSRATDLDCNEVQDGATDQPVWMPEVVLHITRIERD